MRLDDQGIEVLCIGRVGVDIYPMEIGVGLEDVETFGKFLGGSAGNVAVAVARHGRRSALISKTGDDPFGRFVHHKLREFGVDDRFVGVEPSSPTPVAFCEIFPPDSFPLYFYRNTTSPDFRLYITELPTAEVAGTAVFWATLTGCSTEPSRETHFAAWEIRARASADLGTLGTRSAGLSDADRGGARFSRPAGSEADQRAVKHTVLDLDYRPRFWPDSDARGDAKAAALEALRYCDVAVGNSEECRVVTGETDPLRAAAALLELGVKLAVVKRGANGALAMTASETVDVPGVRVDVKNGLGAGDAFGGALCHGLLSQWPLERTLSFANQAGAMVASRIECSPAMPTEAEVLAAL